MPNTERVEQRLTELTVAEKAELVTGLGFWDTRAIERAGIPSMIVTDGPNGARGGGLMGTGTPTACIPAGSVLGATWDPALVEELGQLLGDEAQAKSARVLLAPTINLHRNPLGGRNFECYSEDPVLSGRIAVGFVRGVQSRGVATTAKHFVANDSEFERNTIDSQVDERTLREVYLVPFEKVVTEAEAWGIMSSYNRLNGTYASEHHWLLTTVLRDEWGFDGFVVSDWVAVRSTADSIKAGLSLEMPGPGRFYGVDHITNAIEAGELEEADLDAIARDVLRVLDRTGAFESPHDGLEHELDRPADQALIRDASAAGTVLLRNDGVLPFDTASLTSLAVIGPNAQTGKVMGGGSARVRAYRTRSPLAAIEERWGDRLAVRYAKGCDIDRSTPGLRAPLLIDQLQLEFFAGLDHEGDVLTTQSHGVAD
ncbi:MAG: beta-glucosidase, partial [Acidimicrobiales bacterium]|nr:beta-glucosidase [Acidimicrobiales bacterium]